LSVEIGPKRLFFFWRVAIGLHVLVKMGGIEAHGGSYTQAA
jgi:hypothetical protein